MNEAKSAREENIRSFWGRYINKPNELGIKPPFDRWMVRRAELSIAAHADRRLAEQTPVDVNAHLVKLGRKPGFKTWDSAQPSVMVMLRNEERPPIWEQVSDWIDRHGALVNSDLRRIAGVDTLKASKMLKAWVDEGILQRDESGGKRRTLYRKPTPDNDPGVDLSLSLPLDNETEI